MIDLEKRIRAAGAPGKSSGGSRRPVYEVPCQICGGAVRSNNLSEVGYIRTRRGTEQFFSYPVLKEGKSGWTKKQVNT